LAKTSGNAGVGAVGHALLTALRAPYVWASLVALALVLLGVGVPAPVDSMLNLIGEATSGVAIFVAGTVLAAYKVVLRVDTLVPTTLKMIVETVALVLLLRLFGVSGVSAGEHCALCPAHGGRRSHAGHPLQGLRGRDRLDPAAHYRGHGGDGPVHHPPGRKLIVLP